MPGLHTHEQGESLEFRELGAVKVARPDLNERCGGQYHPSTQTTQGLTEKAIELYNSGKACYADWCNLFEKYDGKIPLEIQTAAQSNPTDKGRVGTLPPLLDFAIDRGADIIELYQAEWFVANDPNHHLYQEYSETYQAALQKAAAILNNK
jgi:hypothetical protein